MNVKAPQKKITIVEKLHSTLDITEILTYFYNFLKGTVTFDSMSYHNAQAKKHFHAGIIAKHTLKFNLIAETSSLGEFSITCQKPFTKREKDCIEKNLCLLINPLKNAITHHNALHAALHDPLTSLLNRSSLQSTLQREIKLSERHGNPLSLIVIDIDDFKSINDAFGHLVGDKAIKKVAAIISDTIRDTDIAYRIGGEEFLIVLSDTDKIGAQQLADRLREQVESSIISSENDKIKFTISIGLACYQSPELQHEFIARADKAMYQAKKSGKNLVITSAE